ncbi:DUF3598 domain-containing protein [Hyphomonas sp.]|uniref:DUF3598 domain-containing protein n=1 Tax=Hyphomonas sp. TaxID=87 RepID=UPI00391AF9D1
MSTAITSTELKTLMPLLARHEGVWEGVYRYYDAAGNKIDEHRSRLLCRFPGTGPAYHQTNLYKWDDGRTEVRDFPASIVNGRISWDNELINGWAADVPLDDFKRTTMLNWTRTGEPDLYLYEMIQISDDGQSRSRTWQWFKQDRLFQRTLIDETFISPDWKSWESKPF